MWLKLKENRFLGWLTLFTSMGTLMCCAIPSLFVLLGFGATFASLLTHIPYLVWFSDNKGIVFGLSFLLLGLSYLTQKMSYGQTCPPDQLKDCQNTKNFTRPVLWISLMINLIGSFYAFVLPKLL